MNENKHTKTILTVSIILFVLSALFLVVSLFINYALPQKNVEFNGVKKSNVGYVLDKQVKDFQSAISYLDTDYISVKELAQINPNLMSYNQNKLEFKPITPLTIEDSILKLPNKYIITEVIDYFNFKAIPVTNTDYLYNLDEHKANEKIFAINPKTIISANAKRYSLGIQSLLPGDVVRIESFNGFEEDLVKVSHINITGSRKHLVPEKSIKRNKFKYITETKEFIVSKVYDKQNKIVLSDENGLKVIAQVLPEAIIENKDKAIKLKDIEPLNVVEVDIQYKESDQLTYYVSRISKRLDQPDRLDDKDPLFPETSFEAQTPEGNLDFSFIEQ